MSKKAAALLLSILVSSPAASQQMIVLGLKQGMPYEDARRVVQSQGWQADVHNPTRLNELQVGLQAYFLSRGFTEIERCLPTGLGTCRGSFHNADGATLFLFTSEPDETGAALASWCLGARERDCRR